MKTFHAFKLSLLFSNIVHNTVKLGLAFVFMVSFSCCNYSKKMDKVIAKNYSNVPVNPLKKKSDYIFLHSNLISTDNKASNTVKGKSKFLPLLIFYSYDYSIVSTLNSNIPIANFNTSLLAYANSKGLKDKMKGRTVELSIDSIPTVFETDDKGWYVFLLLVHFGGDLITVNPERKNLVVSYSIFQDTATIKKGVINIENTDSRVRHKFLQGLNKMVFNYLSNYDENIKLMSKKVVDALILEL